MAANSGRDPKQTFGGASEDPRTLLAARSKNARFCRLKKAVLARGQMHRREFITLIGGAAGSWPVLAHANPPIPMIGLLGSESLNLWTRRMPAFHQGLSETGYVDGRNVAIEYR